MLHMRRKSPVNDKHFESGAQFSRCRTFRYALWRRWDWQGYQNQLMFIGLNPSTADETQDDPTVRRCIRFAKDWGYSGLIMMNAYGFRATDPKVMAVASDPVGPGNDRAFRTQRSQVGKIVAAWGNHCSEERAQRICKVINRPIHCLATNKSGQPKHPLYIAAKTRPKLYWSPASV